MVRDGTVRMDPFIKEQRIKWACSRKLKFTMEEAAQKFGSKPDDVLLYICPHCSFLHFGHKPTWEMTTRELRERAYQKKLEDHKRKMKGYPWSNGNRSRDTKVYTRSQTTARCGG